MGANQFEKAKDRRIFFNWFFFTLYVSSMVSYIVVVYIEDNVSWGLGFAVCLAANLFGLATFALGKQCYHLVKPRGTPFMDIARVIVAATRKRKVVILSENEDYYHQHDEILTVESTKPKDSFRFLNAAALKTEGDIKPEGSNAKPWRLCSVQQVENLKILIRIFPLWSRSIFLATPITIETSLVVLQILTMDRHICPHPSGWAPVSHAAETYLSISDTPPTNRNRTVVEHAQHLVLVGIGEAFHFPGQVALYYQEFPLLLKSTATTMISLIITIAFYLGAALIDLVKRISSWLPDDINNGRLDNVYWALVVMGIFNFGYYLVCSSLYKYQNVEKEIEVDNAYISD
ncbi:protein NRT1/ PTR FAMILY 2.7-like [Carica papaya]|uniref:protein NRT1/ PTR FAMILY 2.7-like n=1 Tax=Carica papaya TaxID=3649 RepID=UPI000B8CCC9A|nr:protein NRT1/ PTR FAMILY 2.7-like [Carica papaya]